jgi:opacity protein-like surface antigen
MNARRVALVAASLLLAAPAFAQEMPPDLPPPAPTPAPAPAMGPAAAAAKKFAQKGVIEVEGGIGFDFSKSSAEGSDASYQLSLLPAARYFIIDKLSVGGRLVLGYGKFGGSSTTTFGLVPLVEYNFDLGSRIYPYVGGGIGFSYTKFSGEGFDASQNAGTFIVGGGVKILFGQGIIGFGLEETTNVYDGGETYGISIFTRYGIWF